MDNQCVYQHNQTLTNSDNKNDSKNEKKDALLYTK